MDYFCVGSSKNSLTFNLSQVKNPKASRTAVPTLLTPSKQSKSRSKDLTTTMRTIFKNW